MALLHLPDEVIVRIGEDVLDAGWDYLWREWFIGDVESLHSLLLVNSRTYALCRHLRIQRWHDLGEGFAGDYLNIENDDLPIGLLRCTEGWHDLESGLGDDFFNVEKEYLPAGILRCIQQGHHTLSVVMNVNTCCDACLHDEIYCGHPLELDVRLAKTISRMRGVKSIDVSFDHTAADQDIVRTPRACFELFSLPSILYICVQIRHSSHANLLGQWLSQTHQPRSLYVKDEDFGMQPQAIFWTSVINCRTWFALRLELRYWRPPLMPAGARTCPLPVDPWQQLQDIRLHINEPDLTEYLLQQVSSSLVASASTLRVIFLPLKMFSAVTQGTVFAVLRQLSLDCLVKAAPIFANRAMSFPNLKEMELIGPSRAATGVALINSYQDVPVLECISIYGNEWDADDPQDVPFIDTLMAICRERGIDFHSC